MPLLERFNLGFVLIPQFLPLDLLFLAGVYELLLQVIALARHPTQIR